MGPTVIFDSWHSGFLAISPCCSGLIRHHLNCTRIFFELIRNFLNHTRIFFELIQLHPQLFELHPQLFELHPHIFLINPIAPATF